MFKKADNDPIDKMYIVDDSPKISQLGRVLIVEDTPIAAKIAEMILSEMGCAATWVTSGEEALLTVNPDFHFILMDLGLPGIDGFEATKQIRAGAKETAQIPIIALTAHEDHTERVAMAKSLGMNGFLMKPFSREKAELLIAAFIHQEVSDKFLMH